MPKLFIEFFASGFRASLGTIIIVLMLFITVFAPFIATHDPYRTDTRNRFSAPSSDNWLGTDDFGRDIYSRAIYGSRVSLNVGFSVLILTSIIGSIIGIISGYFSKLDMFIMRIIDGIMSFPPVFLAIAIMAALGPRLTNVIIALTITYTPHVVRVARSVTLGLKNLEYIYSAKASGANDARILFKHIAPNMISSIIVQGAFIMAIAIIAEAGLSFVGVGTPPPTPSWGNMISDGRQFIYQAPWLGIFPGIFILISVLGINLLGDALRDFLDPHHTSQINM